MSESARLRAQKAHSTDPDYLERMALAEEEREAHTLSKQVEKAPVAVDQEAAE